MNDLPILTGCTTTNAQMIRNALTLYVPPGAVIADVTYGRGVFWKDTNRTGYTLLASDIQTGVDFRALPYADDSIDCLVLDPPYMHGGATVKESINTCYKNENGSHESVLRLYAGGILEAARVLKKKGIILIKCQDEIESGKQRMSHVEILSLLTTFGFAMLDLMVLIQSTIPAMRETYQKSARKNHSYLIIGQFRR